MSASLTVATDWVDQSRKEQLRADDYLNEGVGGVEDTADGGRTDRRKVDADAKSDSIEQVLRAEIRRLRQCLAVARSAIDEGLVGAD